MYYDHVFVTDSMAVVTVDCTITSEGRGMGFYVSESEAVMFADRFDESGWRIVKLTEDELARLDEELSESDECNRQWNDRSWDWYD